MKSNLSSVNVIYKRFLPVQGYLVKPRHLKLIQALRETFLVPELLDKPDHLRNYHKDWVKNHTQKSTNLHFDFKKIFSIIIILKDVIKGDIEL